MINVITLFSTFFPITLANWFYQSPLIKYLFFQILNFLYLLLIIFIENLIKLIFFSFLIL
jgi:hypothetical protein